MLVANTPTTRHGRTCLGNWLDGPAESCTGLTAAIGVGRPGPLGSPAHAHFCPSRSAGLLCGQNSSGSPQKERPLR